jgi:hypothetical protein
VTGICANPWAGARTGGGYLVRSGLTGGNRATILLAFARDTLVALSPGTRYIAGVIDIDTGGSCSGCEAEMCVAFLELELDVEVKADQPGNPIYLTRSTGQTVVTFNSKGGDNPCGSTVRNRTWGQVKNRYR